MKSISNLKSIVKRFLAKAQSTQRIETRMGGRVLLANFCEEEDGKKTGNSYKADEVLCFFECLGNHRFC